MVGSPDVAMAKSGGLIWIELLVSERGGLGVDVSQGLVIGSPWSATILVAILHRCKVLIKSHRLSRANEKLPSPSVSGVRWVQPWS